MPAYFEITNDVPTAARPFKGAQHGSFIGAQYGSTCGALLSALTSPRDTSPEMSQENVQLFRRALEAFNRRDFDPLLEQLDPEAEWHPGVAASLGGEATTFRGHEEVRKGLQDLIDAFEDLHLEVSEMRDLGDRVLAMGHLHAHGTESGVEIESPWAYLVEYESGKATWVRAFLDPKEAFEAAGLRE